MACQRYFPARNPRAYADEALLIRLNQLLAQRQASGPASADRWEETQVIATDLRRRGIGGHLVQLVDSLAPEEVAQKVTRPAGRIRPVVTYPSC